MRNLILSALILASAFQAVVGEQDGEWAYSVSNNQATIISYTGAGGSVTIPPLVNGIPVAQVGSQNGYDSFLGSNKTSVSAVTIPNGVICIGNYAFYGCEKLASVNIPAGATDIGASAFCATSLANVSIPASVTNIGNSAFYNCTKLYSITVDFNNQKYSSDVDGVLFNKDKTVLIQYPGGRTANFYAIPESVTSIGDLSFSRCNRLVSITVPSTVTIIGSYAFHDCPWLTSVNIPEGVTDIGAGAFRYCTSLDSIDLPNSLSRIENGTFDSCYSLLNLTIGNNVTSIGHYAFYSCRRLSILNIPSSVISIGNYAFYSCEKVSTLHISENVTSIGSNSFDTCTGLSNLIIGKGLASLGDRAFYSCTSLSNISVDSDNSSYTSDAGGVLFNKDKSALIQYPAGRIGNSYSIPESVTSIENLAFHLCRNLASITIPSTVNWVGENAFFSCPNLTRVIFQGNAPSAYSNSFLYTLTKIYYYSGKSGWGSTLAGLPATQIVGPSIKALDVNANGTIQLSWAAIPDVDYAVQSSDKLTDAFVTRSIRKSSSSLETWADPAPDSSGMRFYRIGLLQP